MRRPTNTHALAVAALALALVATACGPAARDGRSGPTGGGDVTGGDPVEDPAPVDDLDAVTVRVPPQTGAPVIVAAPSRQAWIMLPPGSLREAVDVSLTRRSLTDFDGAEDLVDGVYSFGPSNLFLGETATIQLPLAGLEIDSADALELVVRRRGMWHVVDDAKLVVADDSATALVRRLGTYGLRLRPEPAAPGASGEGRPADDDGDADADEPGVAEPA